ncbi:MAG: dihydrofolate reductase family protein [Yoonia sp.]|uniref:dihydrofolate reductase family protein n=1 Tax=Yoonia sp. TaxID=2212373 RepID=UPI003EF32BA2
MMAMSLDGFVARKDHTLDWLNKQPTENEDHGFFAFMDSVDALVMGSGSLRTVLGFGDWPYLKPVITLSRTMTKQDLPEHLQDKITFSTESPEALWSIFGKRGYKRIYVDGGAVIRSFLQAGLIQDMKITVVPILLGNGIRLFGETAGDIDLELTSATPFPSGLVDLHYTVKGA